jgi:putative (di)nucleoside polyphosphate hydrolase
MIRKAVGAIVKHENDFLLVHKIKIMDLNSIPLQIDGEWDFPKGGIQSDEIDLLKAVLRELNEETGSAQYGFIKKFDEKICFTFPFAVQQKSGFERQETTMFLFEYMGDRTDLSSQNEEIDQLGFFSREEVIEKLTHEDTREYFKRLISDSLLDNNNNEPS